MSAPRNTKTRPQIHQIALLLHIHKTSRLIGALMSDQRIASWRKVSFIGILLALLAALLVPEAAADIATALIPVFNLFGVPPEILGEAGIDWTVLAVAAFNLLRLFPMDIVGKHYDHLFRR